jgi:protoporphyrinogen oxidase
MTIKVKFLILGAGPSGLSFATQLLRLKETSFMVLEKENEAGGLCRSREVDGSPLDIGGGHFLDVRREKVLNLLFEFLAKDEWNSFDRVSKIRIGQTEIHYPYEANIWELPTEDQIDHLISIVNAGSNQNAPMPKKFSDWITWKLGALIADNYLLPYNSKIFADVSLEELGTYWLYKLPNVSFEDTLRSCLFKKPYGSVPAHAKFYYPKQYGYGEVFNRMADSIGSKLLLNYPVNTLDAETTTVNHEIQADTIISTIPWPEGIGSKSFPSEIKKAIRQLKFSSIDVTYRPDNQATNAHWIYFPDRNLPYHRILYRQNFLTGAKGYWEETNTRRLQQGENPIHHNEYAYPLNTIQKPQNITKVLAWARSRSIIGLGRWGEWEHMNSDVAIEKGIDLAENLLRK